MDRHRVHVDGKEVHLTAFEFKLLVALMEYPGRVFSREHLLAQVDDHDEMYVVDRTMDVRDWLITALSHTGLGLWLVTVILTSFTFCLVLTVVRWVILNEVGAALPDGSDVADVFPVRYILVGGLIALVLSSFRRYDSLLDQRLARGINALAESLENTDRLRRELVSNLAHEIRTPLSNLQGYLEALRDGVIEPTPKALSSVHDEVMRLVRLVDALHRLARADALRHQPLTFGRVDLDGLVEQRVRVIQPMVEARSISLNRDLGARRIEVPCRLHRTGAAQPAPQRRPVHRRRRVIRIQTACTGSMYRFTCRM